VIPVLEAEDAVSLGTPRLIVTRDSKTISEFTFNEKKVVIGRSDFADIVIEDEFASKMHALILMYSDALVLLDLNSANGTSVNSAKVRTTLLQNNDIVAIGHHRLKVKNAPKISADMAKLLQSPDTVKMRNLAELRRTGSQQNSLTAV
jgi:pSer/pThr/pTyr-binding forkhead associated (FHA) protein